MGPYWPIYFFFCFPSPPPAFFEAMDAASDMGEYAGDWEAGEKEEPTSEVGE
jgi:hypothetical protein